MRIEHDLLGEREVPQEAWWGIHTLRAIENFQISGRSVGSYPEFVRALVRVKAAAAYANHAVGALSKEKADAICQACEKIANDPVWCEQFPSDIFQGGAGTSVNMNTNEVVANVAITLLGYQKGQYDFISPFDDVNMSQSTNDVYPTAISLACYEMVEEIRLRIAALADAFLVKGQEFADYITMGRTQLQDAVPMTLGQEMHAFATLLLEEIIHLGTQSALLLEVNLGATAIGTRVNAPDGYQEHAVQEIARITSREVKPASDLVEATSDTGAFVSMHGSLKRLSVKISKICNDLRLLSSGPRAGLNEINLPQVQAGSSIMPAKVNPVIPEVVNQVTYKVRGNDVTITDAAEAGQLQLNVMEPVIAQCLFESIDLLKNAVDTLREKCVEGITANPEICRQYVERSIGLVTYLNPYIGHVNGDLVGRECAKTGKSVREVVLERGLLDAETLDKIFSVENLLRS